MWVNECVFIALQHCELNSRDDHLWSETRPEKLKTNSTFLEDNIKKTLNLMFITLEI